MKKPSHPHTIGFKTLCACAHAQHTLMYALGYYLARSDPSTSWSRGRPIGQFMFTLDPNSTHQKMGSTLSPFRIR